MSKSKVILGTLLIFALGVLAGAFGANMYFKYRIEHIFSKGEPPPVVDLFMKRLSSKLDLTDSQKREIEAIVRQSHRELREVRSRFRPEIKEIIDRTFAEIETKLDQRQQRQLDEFRKRFCFISGHKANAGIQPSKPFERIAQRFIAELDQRLDLNEEQRRKVHEIVETHAVQMREIFMDAREKGQVGRGELGVSFDRLNRQTEARLQEILTEEQMMTFRAVRDEQRQEVWAEMIRKR